MIPIKRSSLPTYIQLQLHNNCNLNCNICPYPGINNKRNNYMKDSDLRRILEEISAWKHPFTLCLMLQNEPLLDPDLPEKIHQCKKELPKQARLILVTNGSLLTSEGLKQLMGAGLDLLDISVNSLMMPLKEDGMQGFRKIGFLDFIRKAGLDTFRDRVKIFTTCYKENRDQIPGILHICEKSDLAFHMSIANDRIQKIIHTDQFFEMDCYSTCLRPCYSLPILTDLDVITCCHDWEHQFTLGNIREKGIEELWNSNKYIDLRDALVLQSSIRPEQCCKCRIPKELHTQAGIPVLLGKSKSELLREHLILPKAGNRNTIIFNYATLEGFEVNMSPRELVMDLKSESSEIKKQVSQMKTGSTILLNGNSTFYNINVILYSGTNRESYCRLLKADPLTRTLFLTGEKIIKDHKQFSASLCFGNSISVQLNGLITDYHDDQFSFKVTNLKDQDWKHFLFLLKDQEGISYKEYQKLFQMFR
jgi:radical SAM protein with 4Fe4S-binding SPASM domain